jgi:hypothetical protein
VCCEMREVPVQGLECRAITSPRPTFCGPAAGGTAGRTLALYDFGASLWDSGPGRASQNWFHGWATQSGYTVERFYLFEAKTYPPNTLFKSVPSDIVPKYSYYNVPVSAKDGDKFHVDFMANSHRAEYVIVKLDIDTPAVEGPLVRQLVENQRYQSLMEEFFFEYHVRYRAMSRWWGNKPEQSLIWIIHI